jgi:hypothetical protein
VKLEDIIRNVMRIYSSDGIEEWNIKLPEEVANLFHYHDVGKVGCSNPSCDHRSHSPRAPMVKCTPKEGVELLALGRGFYYIKKGEEDWFLEILKTPNYYTGACIRDPELVPLDLVSELIYQGSKRP